MNNAKRLFALLLPHRQALLGASLILITASLTNLALPLFVKKLVDTVTVHKSLAELDRTAMIVGALLLAQLALSTIENYLFDITQKRVTTDFRQRIFSHLQRLSLSFYAQNRTGEIVSRLTNDVAKIENIITDVPATLLQQGIRLIGGIGIVIYMNWKLTFLILALAPILVLFARTFGRKLKKLSTEIQDRLAESTTILEENISCIAIVKSFVRESLEYNRFAGALEKSFQAAKKRTVIASFFGPMIGFIAFGTSLTLLWYGGREVIQGAISPGELIAFILYATIIAGPMGSLARMFTRLQEGLGASEKIFALLDTAPQITDSAASHRPAALAGRIELRGVRFAYRPEQEILRGIDLDIAPGEMAALVGPSGAGKSTLAQLLHRFYDPTAGEIRIDGLPLRGIPLAGYYRQIGLVPQETILFGGTIAQNLLYAKPDAAQEELIAAAQAANAHQFIMECPEQYATVVGEKGIKLSAGQRQRIAIARVILKNPRLLILDEATSALDNASEALVQEALDRLMRGRTTVVIAHRLTTVHNADKIIVLDRGQIVEMGTHAGLLAQGGLYHYLYNLKKIETLHEVEARQING